MYIHVDILVFICYTMFTTKNERNNIMKEEKKSAKVKISTVVGKHYYADDKNRHIFMFRLSENNADKIENIISEAGMSYTGDSYPIKETDDGVFLKASSKYDFPVKGMPPGYCINDIGSGTELVVYINMKEGQYGRKKYISAYISALDVRRFCEKESVTPFEDEEYNNIDNPFCAEDTTSSVSPHEIE